MTEKRERRFLRDPNCSVQAIHFLQCVASEWDSGVLDGGVMVGLKYRWEFLGLHDHCVIYLHVYQEYSEVSLVNNHSS